MLGGRLLDPKLGLEVIRSREIQEGAARFAGQLVEDTGVTYDLGRDPRGDVLVDMGGANLPITALVRADGTIAAVITSGLTAGRLTERILSDLLT